MSGDRIDLLHRIKKLEQENEELRERATPKKPIKTRVSYDVGYDDVATADAYDCPTCNKRIADDYMDMNRYNYCPHCQQAIDWSEEE